MFVPSVYRRFGMDFQIEWLYLAKSTRFLPERQLHPVILQNRHYSQSAKDFLSCAPCDYPASCPANNWRATTRQNHPPHHRSTLLPSDENHPPHLQPTCWNRSRVVTVAALIAAAMGIASLMTTSIIERSKEIGLMKALGAYQWQIVLLFYCEAVINAFIGGLLGCIAGWGLARFIGLALFGSPLSFTWIVVPCVLVLSVLIALSGTWLPAHRIARLYPVEVLYERQ